VGGFVIAPHKRLYYGSKGVFIDWIGYLYIFVDPACKKTRVICSTHGLSCQLPESSIKSLQNVQASTVHKEFKVHQLLAYA